MPSDSGDGKPAKHPALKFLQDVFAGTCGACATSDTHVHLKNTCCELYALLWFTYPVSAPFQVLEYCNANQTWVHVLFAEMHETEQQSDVAKCLQVAYPSRWLGTRLTP